MTPPALDSAPDLTLEPCGKQDSSSGPDIINGDVQDQDNGPMDHDDNSGFIQVSDDLIDLDFCRVVHHTEWDALPLWAMGIHLRRLVLGSQLPLSELARLAKAHLRGDERGEVESHLLPLPLPLVSAEEKQDRALREFNETIFGSEDHQRQASQWEEIGLDAWMWVIVVTLNYMYSGQERKAPPKLKVSSVPLSADQMLALKKLKGYVKRTIGYPPAIHIPQYVSDWST